jgi:hypothetical protein
MQDRDDRPSRVASLSLRYQVIQQRGRRVAPMRISTVREFRDKATGLLRSKTPILVTRRGRLAHIFFPRPEITLPIELKRELYDMLSNDVAR